MGAKVPIVMIVNGDGMYSHMFTDEGWAITDRIGEADLVQFCGGADVSPSMYGEPTHSSCYVSPERDRFEAALYELCLARKIRMAGICRGGQFLNVMNGGKMWQDVDKHAIGGTHSAFDHLTGSVVRVTSTHHQMMRPAEKGAFIILTARVATRKVRMGQSGAEIIEFHGKNADVEAVYYPETQCLCFQPHPELGGKEVEDCRALYFTYLEEYLGLTAKEEEPQICAG
jgi:gamma-glutamyl-gamma-aminobutyrate hydrolase PuuD